ncbi:MAG: ABC transporter permease [Chloroflexi bacterium]|nr:ABC transporter permease [Chloroflexota bacterium]
MGRFLVRRFLRGILVVLGVSTIVFGITHLSGDPVSLLVDQEWTHEQVEQVRRDLGLDKPVYIQYVRYWQNVLLGDWGQSLRYRRPALSLVWERFPATVELAAVTLIIVVALSIPAGVIAAVKRGGFWDQAIMTLAMVGQSWPTFWLGLVLILVFAVKFHWLPTSGRGGFDHLILPAFTLAFLPMAMMARLTRSAMLDVLRADYIRTARAKGLRNSTVIVRHALRNAAIPVVTILGIQVGSLLAGAVVTETVFAWPGVGRAAVEAVQQRDYPVVQAVVLLTSVVFVTVNLAVDTLYGVLDPRIRYA